MCPNLTYLQNTFDWVQIGLGHSVLPRIYFVDIQRQQHIEDAVEKKHEPHCQHGDFVGSSTARYMQISPLYSYA